ncbi:MAG: hypothetical protein U0414_02555 [Polyangiaceae bacterium]
MKHVERSGRWVCRSTLAVAAFPLTACLARVDVREEPRIDDEAVVVSLGELSLHVERSLHARTRLVAPSATALVWSCHVDASAVIVSVEPVRGEGAPSVGASPARVDGSTSGFDLELFDADLRRALRGLPVELRLTLESGAKVDASFDVGLALLQRAPDEPNLLPATLVAVDGDPVAFEGVVGGPSFDTVAIESAEPPSMTHDDDVWRFQWGLDDALTSALWMNGVVRLHGVDFDGTTRDANARLSVAIQDVRVRATGGDLPL